MATGREQEELSVSPEVTGSEIVFDHVCNPCSEDKVKEAIGLCVDCEEWLCEECFRIHTRPKPSRNHVLMGLEEMKTSTLQFKKTDKCTEKCDQHNGKKLKYFCPKHDFLGCSMCIFESHRSCEVQQISNVAINISDSIEFKQLVTKLVDVADASNEIVTDINYKGELARKSQAETRASFRKYKEELIEAMNEVGDTLERKCQKKNEEEIKRLENITPKCEHIENESLKMKSHLESLEWSGKYCNTFVAMKRSARKLQEMEIGVKEARDSSRLSAVYTVEPNKDVLQIINGPDGMGTLVQKRHISLDIKTQRLVDISVKTNTNGICLITASALLPNNKLVLTDNYNRQLKVIDTNQNKMTSVLVVDGKPWSVCKANDNTVAVTMYAKHKILFIRLDSAGKLSVEKELEVSGQCRGVAVTDDRIVVSYISPAKLEVMTMDGSVIKTFAADCKGRRLFSGPQYVTLSSDNKLIYVSDVKKNSVICMRMDGTVIDTYTDSTLRKPEQAAVDSNGMTYIGGSLSNNVHIVTPDCKKIKVLDVTDGLKSVFAVSFCEITDRLYIGMYKSSVIKVFQLS